MTDKERFIKLSWEILEHKVNYYILSRTTVDDHVYDNLEQEYLKLCVKLDEPNSLVHKEYEGITGYKGEGMMEVKRNHEGKLICVPLNDGMKIGEVWDMKVFSGSVK